MNFAAGRATVGLRTLSQFAETAPEVRTHPRHKWIAFLIAIAVVAAAAIAFALHQASLASTPASVPAVVAPPTVPTTLPYTARPGPGGTTVLTESVDPLTLSVPDSWHAPAADPFSLPPVINAFAAQAPALASPLQSVVALETKSGIRLFAYAPAPPYAFVSVISFSSPSAKPYTPESIAAIEALAQKQPSGLTVGGESLPVGEVLDLRSSVVVQKQDVAIEILVLIEGGRT
ncbi:MAG: hypothetical protein ACRDZ8_06450, partial [Acidimicrobiales bacterium]